MMKKKAITFLSLLLFPIVWELVAQSINKPELFPSVVQLVKTLGELFTTKSFYLSLTATIGRGFIGLVCSLVLAFGAACLLAKSKWLNELFRPFLTLLRSIPVISFILLALIFLNPELIPLFIAFLTMFPLLTDNLTKGIQNLDPKLTAYASAFHIKNSKRLVHIYYPQIKPFLFSGLASAMGFGWRAIIMGEVLSQCNLGIGSQMKQAQTFIEVPELIAWTIVAVAISFLFDKGISLLEKANPPIRYTAVNHTELSGSKSSILLENISFGYQEKNILTSFNYTFEEGKIYGISAPSGTGKTTLLNLICGLLQPSSGNVSIQNEQGTAYVFQEPRLLPNLSVIENITLPVSSLLTKQASEEKAMYILKQFHLEEYRNNYPNELSYGQQQRIAIARALLFPSSVILMDEPFKGIDDSTVKEIIAYILDSQKVNKQTILFTSHNQEELALLSDEVVRLDI